MKHTIVMVTWHDAHSIGDTWMAMPVDTEPCIVQSIGWLMPEAKPDYLVIAQSYTNEEMYDHLVAIPVGMIKETKLIT
jgi:hypothetical protein